MEAYRMMEFNVEICGHGPGVSRLRRI